MKAVFLTALAGVAVSSSALGAVFSWNYNGVSPAQNPNAGAISNINASFNNTTDAFSWDVTYSDGATKDTDGFWLVVNDGPIPRGTPDEYAIIYFDATNLAAPKVSVYRYSGQNNGLSWQTPGDLLLTNQMAGSGITATATQTGTQRRFQLSFDATGVNTRYSAATSPSFPDWDGVEFGNNIGVWFHTVAGASFGYNNTTKKINSFSFNKEGWLDTENQRTIPAPASAALVALGGLVAARRRRN
jgi:hypothetical protein